MLALHEPNDMHPAVRFAARMARACVGIVVNLPHLLMGKPERVIRPLLGIALACGGLKAWMSPDRASEGAWYGDADASKANVTSAETDTDQDEYKAAA